MASQLRRPTTRTFRNTTRAAVRPQVLDSVIENERRSTDAEGTSLKSDVQAPVQVQSLASAGGTTSQFQSRQVYDSVFQWLKDTF